VPRSYKDYLTDILPPWLRDPAGEAWPRSTGDALDDALDRFKAAVRSRLPAADAKYTPPSDALAAIGGERQLERSLLDTDATYQARLANAWATWGYGGTANGLLQALWDLGYKRPKLCITNGLMYSLDGSRSLVLTTLQAGSWLSSWPSKWNRFDVLFVPTLPLTADGAASNWPTAVPASNSDEINALRRIIRRWKPASAVCNSIVIVTAGRVLGYPTPQYLPFTWSAGLTVALNQWVLPTVANGHVYRAGTVAPPGHTGGVEPTWPTTTGGTVVDGDIRWQEIGAPPVLGGNTVITYSP